MSSFISSFKALSLADASTASPALFPELSTPEQQAESAQWTTLAERLPESLVQLNETLKTRTFVLGSFPSAVDLTLFVKVLPLARAVTDVAAARHILRWVDLVQNTLVSVPVNEKLVIDYTVELPREIKAKPEKKKAEEAKEAPKAEVKEIKEEASVAGKELTEEQKKARTEAQKAKKAARAAQKAEINAKAAVAAGPSVSMIDFRVGFIQKCEKHPDADSLYVSTIDMGDAEGPRTVCSGLVKYFPLEAMQERWVVCIANLKPVNMRGVKSCAMVLCASDEDKVEFVNPPAGSKPGDHLFFEGNDGTPEKVLNPKKKVWETYQPGFSTNEGFEVTYTAEGKPAAKLVNAKGEVCKNSTIVKANVR
ncbi:hypothetical protein BABINDRAFT_168714 [Babjeviella inositovora NRRL Y-12698]|uniref:tRNA-binding domain-containing protein n=1 Tax=Babjeviella inositovora NRRL Y-12698 TaxID=984486 RepID=A0A1E3QJG6_9ASCO|nr:uncharacterized protein BABINDRAFT_168714 [Babjeviella inositovora NRRL Y-12698]ODQ77748.1 hypothetical protein BABINDRAFT_168714 [Babjeviella inositovora NRRL Y-12698]